MNISIHAPRVGSDQLAIITIKLLFISIHAPRVGSDQGCFLGGLDAGAFQSTLPVWGATCWVCARRCGSSYFNPRSPCGERLRQRGGQWLSFLFQSTLPVWGATAGILPKKRNYKGFQSTLPVWGATEISADVWKSGDISIHAPRVGSDFFLVVL